MNGTAASNRTPAQFLLDVREAAAVAGIVADRRNLADGMAPFADFFCTKPVEIRTTSLPIERREVSFRFVDETANGAVWALARRWFELRGPACTFMNAVHAACPVRAEGVDSDARTGFRKVWAFLAKGLHAERFAALEGAPAALRGVKDVLKHYGLEHLSIVGTDHHNETCNLYPVLRPGWANRELVGNLAKDLGFAPLAQGWLDHVEHSVAANLTFSWSSGQVQRLAFYRPAMTLDDIPDDPVLRRFAAGCPIVAPQRAFIPSIAYAHTGHYRKVEVDYDGQIIPVLVRCAMVQPEEA